jgi:hypothetical protein
MLSSNITKCPYVTKYFTQNHNGFISVFQVTIPYLTKTAGYVGLYAWSQCGEVVL